MNREGLPVSRDIDLHFRSLDSRYEPFCQYNKEWAFLRRLSKTINSLSCCKSSYLLKVSQPLDSYHTPRVTCCKSSPLPRDYYILLISDQGTKGTCSTPNFLVKEDLC